MSTVRTHRGELRFRRRCFIADRRGAVSFEVIIVYIFIITTLLLPLADLAIAGFKFIAAKGALRGFGQSILYNPPPDVTNASGWVSTAIAKADSRFPIPTIQLICGDNKIACSASNPDSSDPSKPKYYVYTTSITLTPMSPLVKSLLCTSNNDNPCTFTLSYSERFQ